MTRAVMSTVAALAIALAVVSMTTTTSVHAAEEAAVSLPGIRISSAVTDAQPAADAAAVPAVDVRLGTSDVLNRGAGVTNKNTLATDNNVFVSNSNVLFRSNDRISLARKIESLALGEAMTGGMDAATLSNNIMRIVQTGVGNDVTMSKMSGVLASKASDVAAAAQSAAQSGSLGDLHQRIMDLVTSVMSS